MAHPEMTPGAQAAADRACAAAAAGDAQAAADEVLRAYDAATPAHREVIADRLLGRDDR